MRIPVYLLALPIIILIWAARAIDGFLVERYPNLVPESKRWMLATGAQGQQAGPGPAQAVPAQAPAAAGAPQAASYGYAEPGAVQQAQQAQQGPYQQPGSYPPGDGAPAPYGQPAHQPGSYQPGATQQGSYQQPGSYQPGTNTAAPGYGTVPPATGYGAPS